MSKGPDPEDIVHSLLHRIAELDTRHGWFGAMRAYRAATGLSSKDARLYVEAGQSRRVTKVLPTPDTIGADDIPGWREWVIARACAAEEFDFAVTSEEVAYCQNVREVLSQALPEWIAGGCVDQREWVFDRTDSIGSLHLRVLLHPYRRWVLMLHDRERGWMTNAWGFELQATLATCLSRRPSVDAAPKNK